MNQNIVVLSGGGSPQSDQYRPVYSLIKDEAARRGIAVHLIDYVGFGHHPDFGHGLNLPDAAKKALEDVARLGFVGPFTLMCRSFGCNVGAYVIAKHRQAMSTCSNVIFWGPAAQHIYWTLVAQDPHSLESFNEGARHKGLMFSNDFWSTFVPIEESLKKFRNVSVSIAYGTKDKYCDAPFANYLDQILKKYTDCPVRVTEIEGAEHEVRPNGDKHVEAQYWNVIFQK